MNPITRKSAQSHPHELTAPEQRTAQGLIHKASATEHAPDCAFISLPDGSSFFLKGTRSSCLDGCEVSTGGLTPGMAKWMLAFATATSMTIGGFDSAFIPEGVRSEHAGRSYARTVKNPQQLWHWVQKAQAADEQYRAQVVHSLQ